MGHLVAAIVGVGSECVTEEGGRQSLQGRTWADEQCMFVCLFVFGCSLLLLHYFFFCYTFKRISGTMKVLVLLLKSFFTLGSIFFKASKI